LENDYTSEILRYPMVGGVRKMFMIVGDAPDQWEATHVQWYAATWPLILPASVWPKWTDLAHSHRAAWVMLRSIDAARKVCDVSTQWENILGKLHDRQKYDVARTFKIYDELRHTRFSQSIVQPLYFSRHGLVWEYDSELMMLRLAMRSWFTFRMYPEKVRAALGNRSRRNCGTGRLFY
jgi:hypothetical protein